MKIRVFEAFAGIGTQRMALRNLGIEHEVVAIAEIDKYAIASYEAIHGEVNNLGDISKIKTEDIPDHDLFTYSFPCQDISIAGKQAGITKNTRSGLLWECEKVIEVKRPKYLLMENVKNLVGKKFKADFDQWLERLEELGYSNYWQVLNAKDYGIPQNRERVFCVSILGEHTPYEFPKGFHLDLRLKDILEDEVEEKFYLSKEQVDRIKFSTYNQNNRTIDTMQGGWRQPSIITHKFNETVTVRKYEVDKENLVKTLRDAKESSGLSIGDIALMVGEPLSLVEHWFRQDNSFAVPLANKWEILKNLLDIETTEFDLQVTEFIEKDGVYDQLNRVFDEQGISPTLTSVDSDKKILIKPYSDKSIEKNQANIRDVEGLSTTITANPQRAKIDNGNLVVENESNFRIRKLTPKECWRLMGCTDDDFEKAQQVNSNSQLYKQAGNAIVVDVLEGIFENLLTK